MTAIITVRNTATGQVAEHAIYNLTAPMSGEEASAWVQKTEYDPWIYVGVRHEISAS